MSSSVNTESDISDKNEIKVSIGKWVSWNEIPKTAKTFDLIEIDRKGGLYQHWVMYLEKGWIIHATQVQDRTSGVLAEKRLDPLKIIAQEDKCRVNNLEIAAKSKGLKMQSNYKIQKAIKDVVIVGEDYEKKDCYEIVPYTVHGQNCEHYGTEWKFGTGFSMQVENKLDLFINGKIPPEVMTLEAANRTLKD